MAVLAVVLYRMSVLATLSVYGDEVTNSVAILFTTATAATINLSLIVVFNWMYTYLAEWLTERELLRTQTEFDDSLTLKIYLLQFVNYYASIFYIAFFKGKFIGYPGNYNRFFNFRQEEVCDSSYQVLFSIALTAFPFVVWIWRLSHGTLHSTRNYHDWQTSCEYCA